MKLANKDLVEMYKTMLKIRFFEEATIELYKEGVMPGLAHPCVGQEAIAVGVCMQLNKDDYMLTTHRGHGHLIAKGGDPKTMMAEILARKTGVCKGKGGSIHLADANVGALGSNGIVGGGLPIAAGAALTQKKLNNNGVTVCLFGDGASNQGTFHEALNLASAWKLPVIFVCENNGYGLTTSVERHMNIKNISDRAVGYGIPGISVDGNDVEAVHESFATAVENAREGKGPVLIEYKTYRWTGHHVGDTGNGIAYRTKEEMKAGRETCPIARLEAKLLDKKTITPEDVMAIRKDMQKEVDEAVNFAKNSPFPEAHEVLEDLYA